MNEEGSYWQYVLVKFYNGIEQQEHIPETCPGRHIYDACTLVLGGGCGMPENRKEGTGDVDQACSQHVSAKKELKYRLR